jgi:hypothetical protein
MRTALRVKFPDHQGKYREFSRFRRSETYLAAEKASRSLQFLSKFPTQRSGNFKMLSGNYFAGSGNFLMITGKPALRSVDQAKPNGGAGSSNRQSFKRKRRLTHSGWMQTSIRTAFISGTRTRSIDRGLSRGSGFEEPQVVLRRKSRRG